MPGPQKVFEMDCCVSSSFVQSCSRQKTRLACLKNGPMMMSYSLTAEFDAFIFSPQHPEVPTFSSPADTDFWFVPICTIRFGIVAATLS
jgi:hypothetical protein